jgi:hypothetical protein
MFARPVWVSAAIAVAAVGIAIPSSWSPVDHSPTSRIQQRFPDEEMRELTEGHTKEEGHAWEMFEWWYSQRAFPNELIPKAAFWQAHEYAKSALPAETSLGRSSNWISIGPDNIGGRVLALAVDPTNPNRIWAGMAAGGLWFSSTAGAGTDAWDRKETGFPSVSVSAIVIDPEDPDRMWIGTGEAGRYNRGQVGTPGARSTYGLGVLRTYNGGDTWQETGLTWTFDQSRAVFAMKLDPANANVLWAATTEGLYKTTNAGTTWSLSHDMLMAMDVVIDPTNSNIVYVSHGQLDVPPAPDAGIYKTTNGGSSWTQLAGGLPATDFGRCPLAIASNGSTVYAGVSKSSTRQVVGLFRSTNGGANWTNVNSTNWASSQAWYDNVIAVHPTQPNRVYAGGLDFYASDNSGPNLTQRTFWFLGFEFLVPPGGPEGPSDYAHADHHAIAFDPNNPTFVYLGTDGGVFKSTDHGINWAGRNGGLVTTQFYNGLANGFASSDIALGGLQDNGTVKYLGTNSWSKVFGGDGGWCGISSANDDHLYEEYVYLNMYKSTDGGDSWDEIHSGNSNISNFIAPFVVCESSPSTLYAGTLAVHKSTNGSSSFNGTPVNTIGVSFTDANHVLASTGSSAATAIFELRLTTNGGTAWTNVTGTLPNRYLTDISFDPQNDSSAWIAFSGYGSAHVFHSTNGGSDWEDRTGNLPDIPCQSIVVDPNDSGTIYVGTDLGVFRSTDAGTNWVDFNAGMPDAMIIDLVFKRDENLLRAATFGNGVYERDLTPATDAPMVAAAISSFQLSAPAPNPFRGETAAHLTLARESEVSAVIVDAAGRRVRTVVNRRMGAGVARLEWDGRDDSGLVAAPGAYFLRVRAGGEETSRKLTLLR